MKRSINDDNEQNCQKSKTVIGNLQLNLKDCDNQIKYINELKKELKLINDIFGDGDKDLKLINQKVEKSKNPFLTGVYNLILNDVKNFIFKFKINVELINVQLLELGDKKLKIETSLKEYEKNFSLCGICCMILIKEKDFVERRCKCILNREIGKTKYICWECISKHCDASNKCLCCTECPFCKQKMFELVNGCSSCKDVTTVIPSRLLSMMFQSM